MKTHGNNPQEVNVFRRCNSPKLTFLHFWFSCSCSLLSVFTQSTGWHTGNHIYNTGSGAALLLASTGGKKKNWFHVSQMQQTTCQLLGQIWLWKVPPVKWQQVQYAVVWRGGTSFTNSNTSNLSKHWRRITRKSTTKLLPPNFLRQRGNISCWQTCRQPRLRINIWTEKRLLDHVPVLWAPSTDCCVCHSRDTSELDRTNRSSWWFLFPLQ